MNAQRGWPVDLGFEIVVPLAPDAVWRVLGDLPRFACCDPFHRRFVVLGPRLAAGVDVAIEHAFGGVRFWRFGRVLRWREGESLAFSDLSARGAHSGFPHVFFIATREGESAAHTIISVRVRGRWTARFVPRPLARLWLHLICAWHARLLSKAFRLSP